MVNSTKNTILLGSPDQQKLQEVFSRLQDVDEQISCEWDGEKLRIEYSDTGSDLIDNIARELELTTQTLPESTFSYPNDSDQGRVVADLAGVNTPPENLKEDSTVMATGKRSPRDKMPPKQELLEDLKHLLPSEIAEKRNVAPNTVTGWVRRLPEEKVRSIEAIYQCRVTECGQTFGGESAANDYRKHKIDHGRSAKPAPQTKAQVSGVNPREDHAMGVLRDFVDSIDEQIKFHRAQIEDLEAQKQRLHRRVLSVFGESIPE